jgi:hypothetical protein
LGILREEKSTAAKFLQEKGVELESIREQLAKALPERQPPHNMQSFPKRDFMVPDAATAKLIAEAIWHPVYGTVNVGGGSDVKSALIGGNWLVSAGPLFAYIRMVDGKVLAMGQRTEGTDV